MRRARTEGREGMAMDFEEEFVWEWSGHRLAVGERAISS